MSENLKESLVKLSEIRNETQGVFSGDHVNDALIDGYLDDSPISFVMKSGDFECLKAAMDAPPADAMKRVFFAACGAVLEYFRLEPPGEVPILQ